MRSIPPLVNRMRNQLIKPRQRFTRKHPRHMISAVSRNPDPLDRGHRVPAEATELSPEATAAPETGLTVATASESLRLSEVTMPVRLGDTALLIALSLVGKLRHRQPIKGRNSSGKVVPDKVVAHGP